MLWKNEEFVARFTHLMADIKWYYTVQLANTIFISVLLPKFIFSFVKNKPMHFRLFFSSKWWIIYFYVFSSSSGLWDIMWKMWLQWCERSKGEIFIRHCQSILVHFLSVSWYHSDILVCSWCKVLFKFTAAQSSRDSASYVLTIWGQLSGTDWSWAWVEKQWMGLSHGAETRTGTKISLN